MHTCSHVSLECHFCHVLHTDSNYKYTNVPRPLPQARLSTYVEWWRRASLAYTDSTNSPKRTTSQCRPSTSTTRLSRWGGRVHLVSTCLHGISETCPLILSITHMYMYVHVRTVDIKLSFPQTRFDNLYSCRESIIDR